jgi:hypothetical protein
MIRAAWNRFQFAYMTLQLQLRSAHEVRGG